MVRITLMCLLSLVQTKASGQLPEHSKKLDADFANLYSATPNLPGVAINSSSQKTTTIRGLLRTSKGKVAANADVWAYGIRGNRIPCRERVRTDAQGRFILKLPKDKLIGAVSWGVVAFHGTEFAVAEDLKPDGKTEGVVTLEPGRTLNLSVRDQTDRPVTAYRVYLEDGRVLDHSGPEPMRIDSLKNSVTCLCILASGFAREPVYIDTTTTNPTLLDLKLSPGRTITGSVKYKNGRPVANRNVNRLFGQAMTGNGLATLTNEDGTFRYAGARTRALRLTAFSYSTATVSYSEEIYVPLGKANITDQDITLPPRPWLSWAQGGGGGGMMLAMAADAETGAVSGHVVDPNGKPVRNFTIRLGTPKDPPPNVRRGGFAAVYSSLGIRFTNPDGQFRVTDLDANRVVRLTASVPGYRDAFVDVVQTAPESDRPNFDQTKLKLQPLSDVRIRVEGDASNTTWSLLMADRSRDTSRALLYLKLGVRRQKGEPQQDGTILFRNVPWNDGLLLVQRDGTAKAFPWNGESEPKIDIEPDVDWVPDDD